MPVKAMTWNRAYSRWSAMVSRKRPTSVGPQITGCAFRCSGSSTCCAGFQAISRRLTAEFRAGAQRPVDVVDGRRRRADVSTLEEVRVKLVDVMGGEVGQTEVAESWPQVQADVGAVVAPSRVPQLPLAGQPTI